MRTTLLRSLPALTLAATALGVPAGAQAAACAGSPDPCPYREIQEFGRSGGGILQAPQGIAVDTAGKVVVSDATPRVTTFDPATGAFVSETGTNGDAPGQFDGLAGHIAIDPGTGERYVTDPNNDRIQVFTATGTFVRAIGTGGTGVGQFDITGDSAIAITGGKLYVADSGNTRIQRLNLDGTGATEFLKGAATGLAAPYGLAVAGTELIVTQSNGARRWPLTTAVANTAPAATVASTDISAIAARNGTTAYVALDDQLAPLTVASMTIGTPFGLSGTAPGKFDQVVDLAIDATGDLLALDRALDRVTVVGTDGTYRRTITKGSRKSPGVLGISFGVDVGPAGEVLATDLGGYQVERFNADGTPRDRYNASPFAEEGFLVPYDVAVAPDGSLWTADPSTGVNHFSPSFGWLGALPGISATLSVTVDAAGNVFVGDTTDDKVRKYAPDGTPITSFGSSGVGDGQFTAIQDVDADPVTGDIFVADQGTNRVSRFSNAGTFLGKFGTPGIGDGEFSTLYSVSSVGDGTVATAEVSGRVQLFDTSGTFKGKFGEPGTGLGGFLNPSRVATDPRGNVYVSELGFSGRPVRKFVREPVPTPTPAPTATPAATPAPTPVPTATPGPPKDTRKPKVALAKGKTVKLSELLAKGLPVKVSSDEVAKGTITATVDGKTGRALGLLKRTSKAKTVRVASAKLTFTKPATKTVRVKLTSKARSALRRKKPKSLRLAIAVGLQDGAGNATTAKRGYAAKR